MRLLQLDLISFGPFTDLALDLSEGTFGLHIIHGPNEAGKSASLRALTSLLFGIPSSTSDNFVHDYRTLRVGGELLHSDGTRLSFVRRKGNKDTLLDPSGAPLSDAVLTKFLGGVDETLFSMMFGLNHSGLLQGGDVILRGGGALGESIFTAGLGATHLRQVLRSLGDDAERLFKPKGSVQSIAQSLTSFKQARETLQASALSARDWLAEDQALRQATSKRLQIEDDLRLLNAEKHRIERLQRALPLLAERRQLLSRWQALGPIRILAPDFGKIRRSLALQRAKLLEQQRSSSQMVGELASKLTLLLLPQPLLDNEHPIMEIHERLGGYRKAAREHARLDTERQQLVADTHAILRDVRPDLDPARVEVLRLTAPKRTRVRTLASQRQAIGDRLHRALDDMARFKSRLDEAESRLAALDVSRDPTPLRAALLHVQKQGSLEDDLAQLLTTLQATEEQATHELNRLGLWDGSLSELESLPTPSSETIDRFDLNCDAARKAVTLARERLKDVEQTLAEVEQKLSALQLGGPVPTETDLEEARSRRGTGWRLVRQAWLDGLSDHEELQAFDASRPLPEAFEESMRLADGVSDRLRREATRVAELAGLLAERDRFRDLCDRSMRDLEATTHTLTALEAQWSSAWKPCSIRPLTPKEMRAWVAKKEKLLATAQAHRLQQKQAQALRDHVAACRALLTSRLDELDESSALPPRTLDELVDHCSRVLDRIEATERMRQELLRTVADLKAEHAEAVRATETSERDLATWHEEWLQSVSDLGLDANTSPPEVNALLDRLEELFKKIDKADALELRIQGVTQDRLAFERDALNLVTVLAPDLREPAAEHAASELYQRFQQAVKVAAARAELEEQWARHQEAADEARRQLREVDTQLTALCVEAGCSSHEELDAAEERSQLATMLQKEIDSLEKQLLEHSAGGTLDDLCREAAGVDPDNLPQRLKDLVQRLDALEAERTETLASVVRAEHRLEQMDGRAEAAEAAERAQAALARIRNDANTYVRLRLAQAILFREIERYRAENQAPLLRRASALFERLTMGSFAALQADYNEQDEPILVGVRPNGNHVLVSGMSEGTRDQLYLCLRLASLEHHAASNEPMPFVVDDILVNFDDGRTSAALQALEDVSRLVQVILYTHHEHLVALARKTVSPNALFIHELSPR